MEEWLSGNKLNCFNLFHERSEGGNQEATVRVSDFHLNVSEIYGRVAEWLKAPHSKRGRGESLSWVQIPPLPQIFDIIYLL